MNLRSHLRPQHDGIRVLLDRRASQFDRAGAIDDRTDDGRAAREMSLLANRLTRDALAEVQKTNPSQSTLNAIATLDQLTDRLAAQQPLSKGKEKPGIIDSIFDWCRTAPKTEVVITIPLVRGAVSRMLIATQKTHDAPRRTKPRRRPQA